MNLIANPGPPEPKPRSIKGDCKPRLIDRLAARAHPGKAPVMRQAWKNLLFLHWQAPIAHLQSLLPPGLRVDTHRGKAWIGIVPFFMRNVRPRFLPSVPGISNFLELNVRTYVYDESATPGVWFFSLDANQSLACTLGRRLFNLNYRNARIAARESDWIDFTARRGGFSTDASFSYRRRGSGRIAEAGSLDFFLTERYVLFSSSKDGSQLWRGRVHHAPYQLQDAELESYSSEPVAWNRHESLPGRPQHVCASPGVEVEVFSLQKL
ncbi:MAG: hypothetical protein CMN02_08755 [Roseibacillus sp.]|nr:hypothetical protein [Roseibacillus sp.]